MNWFEKNKTKNKIKPYIYMGLLESKNKRDQANLQQVTVADLDFFVRSCGVGGRLKHFLALGFGGGTGPKIFTSLGLQP